MSKIALLLAGIGLALLAASPAKAQQTWVSGTNGNDNNDCSRGTPCATFQRAFNVTPTGGEISCLDAGRFGGVSIFRSVTISCEAGTASLQGDTITIFQNPGKVTLRGLDMQGTTESNSNGCIGIWITGNPTAVHIENVRIRGYGSGCGSQDGGIMVNATSSSTTFLYIADSVISSNGVGVRLQSSGGYKIASLKNVVISGSASDGVRLENSNVFVNVTDSIISGNGGSAVNTLAASTTANIVRTTMANNAAALNAAAAGSTIRVSNNDIYNNTFGFLIAGGASIQSDGSNKTGFSNGGAQAPNASLALY
jgi:hypothetical protein